MQKLLTTTALILALATPTLAGGPVVIEDMTETAPIVQDRDKKIVPILLGLALAALILGGGSDACNGDPQPQPPAGGC